MDVKNKSYDENDELLEENEEQIDRVEEAEDENPEDIFEQSGDDELFSENESNEDDTLNQPLSMRNSSSDANAQPRKYVFKLKQLENGNILTVHNTVEEDGQVVRIRIAACCFNEQSNLLVVIDKRGSIFVFDFVGKRYWRLNFRILKVTLVRPSPIHKSEYIVGNKDGQIYVIDIDRSVIVIKEEVGNWPILDLSYGARLQFKRISNTLLRFSGEAKLINLKTLQVSHQLEFDQVRFSLKMAGYLPNSELFFTCFTNDSIHVWSTQTLNTLKVTQPIKARNRRIRLLPAGSSIPEFILRDENETDEDDELTFSCRDQDFADGYLVNYCFTPDGNKFCLTTLDGYLLVLSRATFDLEKLYRLRDFILTQIGFLTQPKERIVVGLTARGQVVMLDLAHTDIKLVVQSSNTASINVSRDGKLLSVLSKCGEVNIWSTCRLYNKLHSKAQCLTLLRSAFKQKKQLPIGNTNCIINEDLRKLLKPERLKAMLMEYGCYPEKYRFLIWSALLALPSNGPDFQKLLKLGIPAIVKHRARDLKIKNDTHRRAVIKVWSCLAHWCKVFGYADFLPHLLFPFVKQLPKNGLIVFELMVTLIFNHFQLWFEFHPAPPANYLAMCENLLQCMDPNLCKFYLAMDLQSKDYAWSLLSNAFAEVLDEQQWLTLWDNVITEPPYFLIFAAVAYNLINREVLLRLPDKKALQSFFHDQNPVDISKFISKARKLMAKCAPPLHPKRFTPLFTPLPKQVYPKFLKYPREWIAQQEVQTGVLIEQHKDIDARIRHLELEEMKVMERLQDGLKQEEHTRRIREMEKLYQDTLQREEERITSQRKMLLIYQKEVRQRKSEVLTKLQETEQRRKALEMERDVEKLMHKVERERRRHDQEMLLAEDEIRNQELELLAQRYFAETSGVPLAQKYYSNIQKLCSERDELQRSLRQMTMEKLQSPTSELQSSTQISPNLLDIELSILEIQREFSDIISSESGKKS